jgi:hypothetical protein
MQPCVSRHPISDNPFLAHTVAWEPTHSLRLPLLYEHRDDRGEWSSRWKEESEPKY